MMGRAASFLLVLGFCVVPTLEANDDSCFRILVKQSGWDVPKLGEKLRSERRKWPETDVELPLVTYRCAEDVWIPNHTIRDERLLVNTLLYSCSEVSVFERDGREIAYVADVRGKEVGIAGWIWWIDADGDGSFEELYRWPSGGVGLPAWVAGPPGD